LAPKPHPSRHGSESASPHPVPCQKDVRRGVRRHDRGQRPQLQKNRGARATTLGPQIRNDYAGKFTSRRGIASFGAGFSILLLDLLPPLNYDGAISAFGRVRTVLWPACFPVYASVMSFPHPQTGFPTCLRVCVGHAVPPATFR
jgi:hypothetical protein